MEMLRNQHATDYIESYAHETRGSSPAPAKDKVAYPRHQVRYTNPTASSQNQVPGLPAVLVTCISKALQSKLSSPFSFPQRHASTAFPLPHSQLSPNPLAFSNFERAQLHAPAGRAPQVQRSPFKAFSVSARSQMHLVHIQ